jgi:hypothetical protein
MLALRRSGGLLHLHEQQQCPALKEFWVGFARQAAGKPTAKKASDDGKLQGNFQQLLKACRQ